MLQCISELHLSFFWRSQCMRSFKLSVLILVLLFLIAPVFVSLFFSDFLFLGFLVFGIGRSYYLGNKNNFIMYFSCFVVAVLSRFGDILHKGGSFFQIIFIVSYVLLCVSSFIFLFRLLKNIKKILYKKSFKKQL